MNKAATPSRPGNRALLWPALLLASLAAPVPAPAQDYLPDGVLRVCQDPNNLPFSNIKGEGFENRIAELFARKLDWKLEYASFPQRMGFIRNTLKFKLPGQDHRCDLVIGVPANYDQASPTRPWFRSTYALVIADRGATADVKTEQSFLALSRAELSKLRIGVYTRSPGAQWLTEHGLIEQAVPYRSLNADPDQYPGEIIERDLAAGKIDAAIVWGPIAGFFASRVVSPPMSVIPLASTPGNRMDFDIAMGVRHEDKAWKAKVQALIDDNHAAILDILRQYRVPLVDAQGNPLP